MRVSKNMLNNFFKLELYVTNVALNYYFINALFYQNYIFCRSLSLYKHAYTYKLFFFKFNKKILNLKRFQNINKVC